MTSNYANINVDELIESYALYGPLVLDYITNPINENVNNEREYKAASAEAARLSKLYSQLRRTYVSAKREKDLKRIEAIGSQLKATGKKAIEAHGKARERANKLASSRAGYLSGYRELANYHDEQIRNLTREVRE